MTYIEKFWNKTRKDATVHGLSQQQQQNNTGNSSPSPEDRMIASFVQEMTALTKGAATPPSASTVEIQTSNDIIILDDSDED